MNLQRRDLSVGLSGEDIKLLQSKLVKLGYKIPADEINEQLFGKITDTAVREFQKKRGIAATGVVDQQTAILINQELAQQSKSFVVRGQITLSDGSPLADRIVKAFDRDLRSEELLGAATTNKTGSYEIRYTAEQFRRAEKKSADLVVRALGPNESPLGESSILFNAPPEATVNLVISGEYRGPSEYERLLSEITHLLEGIDLAELREDAEHQDITFLSRETGNDPQRVGFLLEAHRLMKKTKLPAEVFYGFARQGLPIDDQSRLLLHRVPALRRALEAAIAANIVPQGLKRQLNKIIELLRTLAVQAAFEPGLKGGPVSTAELLGASRLPRAAQERFIAAAAEHEGNADEFWRNLAKTPEFRKPAQIDEARTALQLGALTAFHLPVVEAIQKMRTNGKLSSLQDLTKLDDRTWHTLVKEPPEGLSRDGYIVGLKRQVEAAFPTAAIAAQIARSNHPMREQLDAFFKAHPEFDLLTDSLESVAAKMSESMRLELKRVQRLARVAPRSQVFQVLSDAGFRSARQIAATSEGAFVTRFSDALGGELEARKVHQSAAERTALAQHFRMRFGREQDRFRPNAIPPAPSPNKTPSDWTTLFGSPDTCACEHGLSVLGPAAYLTDLLQFLEKETNDGVGLKVLLEPDRRPDLKDIALNAFNAETPMPYIDLVNEIFEQAVAGTTNSQKWQTTWSAAELAANPEHVEPTAYDNDHLRGAIYPWDLPFDLNATEARVYLAHLGTSRHELIQAFCTDASNPDPLQHTGIAREYLGLTSQEWNLISGSRTFTVQALWGFGSSDDPVAVLKDPRLLMERAGITFDELEKLLQAIFINPSGKSEINYACACTLERATIDFADSRDAALEMLSRFCRFVRLQRLLGWSVAELDAALAVFSLSGSDDTVEIPLLVFSHLQRLRERLALPVIELLSLYTDLNRLPAPAGSQPGETFLDAVFFSRKVVPRSQEEDASSTKFYELLHTETTLQSPPKVTDYLPRVTAALGVSATDVLLLLQSTNADLSVGNLSFLYRSVRLCRAVELTAPEFVALTGLTGLQPVLAGSGEIQQVPRSTLAFLAESECLRNSGFGILELDGLLRHRKSAETAETSLRQDAIVLQQLRTGLQKIVLDLRSPANATATELEQTLRQQLAVVVQPDAVQKVVGWAQSNLSDPVPPEISFLGTLPLLPALPNDESSKDQTLSIRYGILLELLLPYICSLQSKALIKQQLSQALQLDYALTEKLLAEWVDAAGTPAAERSMEVFLEPDFVSDSLSTTLAPEKYSDQQAIAHSDAFRAAFQTVARLRKVALVLSRLRLTFSQARCLFEPSDGQSKGWLDLAKLPVDETDDNSLYRGWQRLVDVCALHRRIGPKEPDLFDLFDLAWQNRDTPLDLDGSNSDPANHPFFGPLLVSTGWDEDALKVLLTDFGYNVPYFTDERAFLKLEACFQLSQRLGVAIGNPWNMNQWIQEPIQPEIAVSIKRAARARYANDEAWAAVARPLQNQVREQKCAALVGYLSHTTQRTPDKLYGDFLIDPEMSACMLTSRIKQATSSVQLYIQRILLGLEGVAFTNKEAAAAEWAWMKNYRVWEANRKVFLWPENWIEPGLRDDKTPFFQELENGLRQNEITPDYVEKVYLNYLQKLDTVSNLEIVGQCYGRTKYDGLIEGSWPTLHVFGRTATTPHVYYYRRRDSFGIWSAWEKLNVDIEGDHLIPIVWNRRLWVFWPVFKQVTEKRTNPPQPTVDSDGSKSYWDEPKNCWAIQFASSCLTHDGWTPKNSIKETLKPWTAEREEARPPTADSSSQEGNTYRTPVYVHDQGDMPGLLAPQFEDNSALFSFVAGLSDNSSTVRLEVRYPCLAVAPCKPDLQLMLPFGGYYCNEKTRSLLWFTPYVGTTIGGAFEVKPYRVHVQPSGGAEGTIGWSTNWLTLVPSSYTIWDVLQNPDSPIVVRTAYPMQGNALIGFGSPSYQGNEPVPFRSLWQAAGGEFEPFRITPLSQTPFAGLSLALCLCLFASDTRHVFHIEARRPRMFYHPFVKDFISLVSKGGIEALLKPAQTSPGYRQRVVIPVFDTQGGWFVSSWLIGPDGYISYPGPRPDLFKPREDITFEDQEAYSIYNWELFFHIPLLIAQRLSENQQFEAAMNWFHYIFDPFDRSSLPDEEEWQRPWRFGRFFDNGDATRSIEWLMTVLSRDAATDSLTDLLAGPKQMPAAQIRRSLVDQIQQWRLDPFKPHLLARMRITPYMKTVVMKYLDNLIAWADQLYRRDTIESINEATQLYILAAEILGPRPLQLPEYAHHDHTYAEIKDSLDDFSNTLEEKIPAARPPSLVGHAEKFIGAGDCAALRYIIIQQLSGGTSENGASTSPPEPIKTAAAALLSDEARRAVGSLLMDLFRKGDDTAANHPPSLRLPAGHLYFCIPQNQDLAAYWDTVADRLFKIRHCLNIEGVERELPLFEPEINPALLVKAAAAGVDFSTVLNDLNAPTPHYRFNVIAQKAAEFCQEVKALGGALLAALEKKDAEGLSLLRATQEISLLEAVREVRKQQVQETQQTFEGLNRARLVTEARHDYYKNIQKVSDQERLHVYLTLAAMESQVLGQTLELGASTAHNAPDEYAGPLVAGMAGGGAFAHLPGSGSKTAASLQSAARVAGIVSTILSTSANLAATQAGQSRRWDDWKLQERMAQQELKQIDKQIAAAEVRVAIAEQEFANQSQQIENARSVDDYLHSKFTNQELYDWMVGQIAGMYFQSYQLAYDTAKRAERAYRFELGLDNLQFIRFGYWDNLRKGLLAGEQLYHDLKRMEADYLDRNRREYEIIKHVSLAQFDPVALLSLRQNHDCFVNMPEALFDLDCPGHYMRRIKSVGLTIPCVAGPYTSVNCTLTLLSSKVRTNGTTKSGYTDGGNYTTSSVALQSIVTSSAQNDGGLFELNFRDDRYLPFEGAGAISNWRIQLPDKFPQFDYSTIPDVVLHVRYTARDGGDVLKKLANDNLQIVLADAAKYPQARLFSLRHDFPTAWAAYLKSPEADFIARVRIDYFPYFARKSDKQYITLTEVRLVDKETTASPHQVDDVKLKNLNAQLQTTGFFDVTVPTSWLKPSGNGTFETYADTFLIIGYTMSSTSN